MPAAAFFGQLPSSSAQAKPDEVARPASTPTHEAKQREREPTQEVSLADMSLSSLGAIGGPEPSDATQDVSLHELSVAARRAENDTMAVAPEPSGLRIDAMSTQPAPSAPAKRWLWVAAALPIVLGAGWFAMRKSPEPGSDTTSLGVAIAPGARPAELPKQAAPELPASADAPLSARAPEGALRQLAEPAVAQPSPSERAGAEGPALQALPDGAATAATRKRADALVAQANTLRKRRKLGPARSKYQAALALVPNDVSALRGLVQIALQQRDGEQAVQRARELVDASPDESGNLVLLGDAYKVAGKPKDARQAWQTAARKGNTQARKRLK